MKRFTLITFTIFTSLYSFTQDPLNISWIENNLMNKIQIDDETSKTYTILEKMEAYNIPGISIAIAKEGKLVYAKGFGIANSTAKTNVNAKTLFQAASISKPITALAILKLVEQGKVDLDTDVNKYLKPWKVEKNDYTVVEKVTLRRLLTHTAGITVHGFPGYSSRDEIPTTIEILEGQGNTPVITVDTIPGSIWRYSGGGYTIIQQIIKDVSGQELSQFMADHIFPVLGMKDSFFATSLENSNHKNISCAYDSKGKLYKGNWYNYPEHAAAGLWTTPSDLIKYCLHIQANYKESNGILPSNLIQEMLTPHDNNWGLGPALININDELLFGHSGKNVGFTNNMYAFIEKGDAIVVLTNGDNGNRIIEDIVRATSNFYNWNLSNYSKVQPIEVSNNSLQKLTGKYSYTMNNREYFIKVKLKNNQLILFDPNMDDPLYLTPIAPWAFVSIKSGVYIDFTLDQNEQPINLIWDKKWIIDKNK